MLSSAGSIHVHVHTMYTCTCTTDSLNSELLNPHISSMCQYTEQLNPIMWPIYVSLWFIIFQIKCFCYFWQPNNLILGSCWPLLMLMIIHVHVQNLGDITLLILIWWIDSRSFFTCVTKGGSMSSSCFTLSVCPSVPNKSQTNSKTLHPIFLKF